MNKGNRHILHIDKEKCIGCVHCMKACPTKALRVEHGKAVLIEERCTDCGECYRVCPVSAISVEQDDFSKIGRLSPATLLIPTVFLGQFGDAVPLGKITGALNSLGFATVVIVESDIEFLLQHYAQHIQCNEEDKPFISPFCPAIVKLIQVRFPSFTKNIIPKKTPVELTALFCKSSFEKESSGKLAPAFFYCSPCAAKTASAYTIQYKSRKLIDGVIHMNLLYNKVMQELHKKASPKTAMETIPQLTDAAIKYSLTHGESEQLPGRNIAVDGMANVIDFLETLENKPGKKFDFLELRACDGSCCGGILCHNNRFLAIERMHNLVNKTHQFENKQKQPRQKLRGHPESNDDLKNEGYQPHSMHILSRNPQEAIQLMFNMKEIIKQLPLTDCGLCGFPDCHTFARSVVLGERHVKNCIFFRRKDYPLDILSDIWGEDTFF